MLTQQLLDRVRRCVPSRKRGVVDPEDLYQSGVLAILEHLADASDGDQPEDLLVTIAWRRMRSLLRRELRHAGRTNGAGFVDVYHAPLTDPDLAIDVVDSLSRLSDVKRRWIESQVREGKSIDVLATTFGIAHSTGQGWNHQIYACLRPALESGYAEAFAKRQRSSKSKRRDRRNNRHVLARQIHPTPEF